MAKTQYLLASRSLLLSLMSLSSSPASTTIKLASFSLAPSFWLPYTYDGPGKKSPGMKGVGAKRTDIPKNMYLKQPKSLSYSSQKERVSVPRKKLRTRNGSR
jgi:hypothetical protein